MGNDLVPEVREAIVPDEVGKRKKVLVRGINNRPFPAKPFFLCLSRDGLENLGPREGRGPVKGLLAAPQGEPTQDLLRV